MVDREFHINAGDFQRPHHPHAHVQYFCVVVRQDSAAPRQEGVLHVLAADALVVLLRLPKFLCLLPGIVSECPLLIPGNGHRLIETREYHLEVGVEHQPEPGYAEGDGQYSSFIFHLLFFL